MLSLIGILFGTITLWNCTLLKFNSCVIEHLLFLRFYKIQLSTYFQIKSHLIQLRLELEEVIENYIVTTNINLEVFLSLIVTYFDKKIFKKMFLKKKIIVLYFLSLITICSKLFDKVDK